MELQPAGRGSPLLKSKDFLACLLSTGYLPEELPPTVSSREFADFCKRHFALLRSQRDQLLKLSTNYDTYSAPRDKAGRRALAVVHPLAQLVVSLLITERQSEIKHLIGKSGTSLYDTENNLSHGRAFAGLNFNKRRKLAAKLHSEKSVILQADISRFFYTAYTHSIPWAVMGKEKAKELLRTNRKKLSAHWSNKFDEALQSCQSRETFGIPVGPDTSRIIAELLLSGVEAEKELMPYLSKANAFRLLDDFSIGFSSEEEAKQCLRALRHVLWKYNLQLNDEKTKITTSQFLFREKWKLDFDRIPLSRLDSEHQLKDIEYLVDLALYHCVATKTATPAQWACRRLSRLRILDDNLSAALDTMFRLARDFPICISYVASFLINNQDRCSNDQIKPRIRAWISLLLKLHLPQGHHFEVAWALVVAGVLRIQLKEGDDIPVDGTFPGSVVLSLFGLLKERNLIDIPLSRWEWRSRIRKQQALGENWLLHYEAVRRKWTRDAQLQKQIQQQPILALALSENIAFLKDEVLDARIINLDKRTFRPRRGFAEVGKRVERPFVYRGQESISELYELNEEGEEDTQGTEATN